jgi:hypothetical protein
MRAPIVVEIISMIQDYIRQNNGDGPTTIHVTRGDEGRLAATLPIGSDVRKHFEKIDGRTVVWDAEVRHCE